MKISDTPAHKHMHTHIHTFFKKRTPPILQTPPFLWEKSVSLQLVHCNGTFLRYVI